MPKVKPEKPEKLRPKETYFDPKVIQQHYHTIVNKDWKSAKPISLQTHENVLADKIYGAVLGLAYGDCYGCLVEGYRWQDIKRIYGTDHSWKESSLQEEEGVENTEDEEQPKKRRLVNDPTDELERDYFCSFPFEYPSTDLIKQVGGLKFLRKMRPLGIHSDDTQQSLGIILSFLHSYKETSTTPLLNWKQMIITGWKEMSWRGVGKNFTMASEKLLQNMESKSTGSPSIGVGSCMKIGWLGALLCRETNLSQFARSIYEITLVTHGTILAGSISFCIAFIVRQLLLGISVEEIQNQLPEEALRFEKEWQDNHRDWEIDRSHDPFIVSKTLRQLFTYLKQNPSITQIREKISQLAKDYLETRQENKIFNFHVNQGPCLLGGMHAIVLSLLEEHYYFEYFTGPHAMLSSIVRLGYDTDTIAAIAGCLLGARFGTSWIPMERLVDIERLKRYAEAIIAYIVEGKVIVPESFDEFFQREAILTAVEKKFQKAMKDQSPKPIKV